MAGGMGFGLVWAALVVACAVLFRGWYAGDARRSYLALLILLALVCPPLALCLALFHLLRTGSPIRTRRQTSE